MSFTLLGRGPLDNLEGTRSDRGAQSPLAELSERWAPVSVWGAASFPVLNAGV